LLPLVVALTLSARGGVAARADSPGGANTIIPLLVPPPQTNTIIANVPNTSGSSADLAANLDVATHSPVADATPARPLGPVTVQGPAGSGQSASYRNATGPLNIAGALDFTTCHGGPTHVSAVVFDENGDGVVGAAVSGYVQFSDSGSSLSFPQSAADGFTEMMFNSGNPRGGYEVEFSLHAEDATTGNTADTTVECYAP